MILTGGKHCKNGDMAAKAQEYPEREGGKELRVSKEALLCGSEGISSRCSWIWEEPGFLAETERLRLQH